MVKMMQIPSIDEVLQQEAQARFEHFDFSSAWEIGSTIREKSVSENYPVSIEVYAFGQTLFLSALEGSARENVEWMARKRNTVLLTSHSSLYVGLQYEKQGLKMEQLPYIDSFNYTDNGGSFPLLTKNGSILGAVTVSGLLSHEDHALGLWAINQYLSQRQ